MPALASYAVDASLDLSARDGATVRAHPPLDRIEAPELAARPRSERPAAHAALRQPGQQIHRPAGEHETSGGDHAPRLDLTGLRGLPELLVDDP